MLRFVEEIVLLLLHDDDGSFVRVPSWSRDYAIAGSILMDLAMENRIDTDLENLTLIDATPLGDSLLDPTLAEIAAGEAALCPLLGGAHGRARRGDLRADACPAGRPRHPRTAGGALPLGLPLQALPAHRR